MQIVYISNRPEILLETLQHVQIFMPFIKQAVVCVPDSQVEQLSVDDLTLELKILPESDILSGDELITLKQLDHQRRNYLLRSKLVAHIPCGLPRCRVRPEHSLHWSSLDNRRSRSTG